MTNVVIDETVASATLVSNSENIWQENLTNQKIVTFINIFPHQKFVT